jgi:hypothetical protein
LFNVVRGPEDKGVPALNCATCHQGANADSTGVPGAPNWRLAPLSMKWQSPDDRNRAKNGSGILDHHEKESLVLWAFQPGRRRDGSARSLPPLTHDELVAATRVWVEAGTPCPQNH